MSTDGTVDYVQVWSNLLPPLLSAETRQFIYAAVQEANRLADAAGRGRDDSLDPPLV